MEQTKKILAAVQRHARVGLIGSVAAVVLASTFMMSPFTFEAQSEATRRWMLIVSAVVAVLTISMVLLVVRRRIPTMRQSEAPVEQRLKMYEQHVREVFISVLVVVVLISAMAAISAQNALLMLAIVATLVLILDYPNIYRIQVDLGLSDDEMRELFGEKFVDANGK